VPPSLLGVLAPLLVKVPSAVQRESSVPQLLGYSRMQRRSDSNAGSRDCTADNSRWLQARQPHRVETTATALQGAAAGRRPQQPQWPQWVAPSLPMPWLPLQLWVTLLQRARSLRAPLVAMSLQRL